MIVKRLAIVVLLGFAASAQALQPARSNAPQVQDAGALASTRSAVPVTVTVALKLRDADQLERAVQAMHTPGSPQFHKFISAAEFESRFAPAAATVNQAIAHFQRAGLTARLESGSLLKVTGSTDAINRAFQVDLHVYDVAANGRSPGYRFRAPVGDPSIAAPAVAANVAGIFGLDNAPHYRPHLQRLSNRLSAPTRVAAKAAAAPTTINDPGLLTVADVARYYNIEPLYAKGYHGEGRTLGIVTLAAFTQSDVFEYWDSVGLSYDRKRIKVVDIDGGPGVPSDDSGSDETTLDVQQAGGLAPAAKMIVYQAPNTDQAFVDAFAKAINDNAADSISVSWGSWEWFDTQAEVKVGRRGRSVDVMHAMNNLFLQAAAQGQTLIAASGDSGAYDVNAIALPPDISLVLSVDAPASSPWIVAAGGTTLPGDQSFRVGSQILTITVPQERAWGWDYLTPLCTALGADPVSCGIFPVGAGGGVSAYQDIPFYQRWVSGIKTTEPGQTLVDFTVSPPELVENLPANFHGRNLPDVSLNADPETGYTLPYTSDVDGFSVSIFNGGTSFVAPQLNGIAALLGQRVHGRLGLLNAPLYALAATPLGYLGSNAPLNDIKAGNNWFYKSHAGYDQGSGVGTLDVSNLAKALLLFGY
ncbi:protease pro-enzyme activation domain-containing protein [soil metagenome]